MEQILSYRLELKNFCGFQKRYPVTASPSIFFDCDNHKGIRLITLLRVGLSHLLEHKFNHDCSLRFLLFTKHFRV